MSEHKTTEQEVPVAVVGLIAVLFLIGGPFIGGAVGNLLAVLGGWGFALGFTVMMWQRTKNPAFKAGLILLLIVAIALSANLSAALSSQ